jgi:hypothetical protein
VFLAMHGLVPPDVRDSLKIMRMRHRTISILWLLGLAVAGGSTTFSADFQFRHHFITRELPMTDKSVGDYGLTALADVDRDGDLGESAKALSGR